MSEIMKRKKIKRNPNKTLIAITIIKAFSYKIIIINRLSTKKGAKAPSKN